MHRLGLFEDAVFDLLDVDLHEGTPNSVKDVPATTIVKWFVTGCRAFFRG